MGVLQVNMVLLISMIFCVFFIAQSDGANHSMPSIYARLDGSINDKYFCTYLADFKANVAKTLILADGVSTAKSSQVIMHKHPCNKTGALLSDVQFYIAKAGSIKNTPDVLLTTLAYKVVWQMIYDGTAWKLGIHLDRFLDRIQLLGTSKPVAGITDVEIVYAGFGAVCLLILLILVTIFIVDCLRKHCGCCQQWCPLSIDETDDLHVIIHVEATEKGITNELFETEAALVLKNKSEPEHEYLELEEKGSIVDDERLTDRFNDVLVKAGVYEEVEIEPIYDNPVESEPLDDLPPPPSYEASDEESDTDEGMDLTAEQLQGAVEDDGTIVMEFENISSRSPKAESYPDDTIEKNRVAGFYPWSESRVPLMEGGYINASFVKNNKGEVAYITTQAPLESTANDFWQMVWEQQVETVVMVTPLNLLRQEMCFQYWPRDVATTFGDIKVQLVKKELKPDFLVMTVGVTSEDESETRNVSLYRYMSWPQSEIPDSSKSIVGFLLEIRENCESLGAIPLFHCSSGRGMSAVLVALYNGMLSAETTQVVNLKKIVRALRKDVPGAIENVEQYKFLYDSMYQYALFNAQ